MKKQIKKDNTLFKSNILIMWSNSYIRNVDSNNKQSTK